jgi:hypothetical protein
MTQNLPELLAAALPLIDEGAQDEASIPFDPAYRAHLLAWGYAVIEEEIRPDPLFRPLDFLRRARARRQWRAAVQAQGAAQRAILAGGLTVVAQERVAQIAHDVQERRRRDTELWNARLRVGEYQQTTRFTTDEEIRRTEALAEIAVRHHPPEPLEEDPFAITARYERKFAEIRTDPHLSQEEKHQQTLLWQASLMAAIAHRPRRERDHA